jgi:hypothetical protein
LYILGKRAGFGRALQVPEFCFINRPQKVSKEAASTGNGGYTLDKLESIFCKRFGRNLRTTLEA